LSLPATKKKKKNENEKIYTISKRLFQKTVGPLSFLFRWKGGNFKMKDYWQLAPTVQSKDLVFGTQKL
jgi:hypothetical protein